MFTVKPCYGYPRPRFWEYPLLPLFLVPAALLCAWRAARGKPGSWSLLVGVFAVTVVAPLARVLGMGKRRRVPLNAQDWAGVYDPPGSPAREAYEERQRKRLHKSG